MPVPLMATTMDDLDSIQTEIAYFSRDEKYNVEKPYTTSFPVSDIPGARVDNHQFEFHKARIQNIGSGFGPKLDSHGFELMTSAATTLTRADFDSPEAIVSRYYGELAELLKTKFPQYKRVAFFDHAIRSRDPAYPGVKGAPTAISQPFRFAHVDFTEYGARLKLSDALGANAEEELGERCDILNIWRLLNNKPTRDWPLCLCDWRSVDINNDLIANDVVYPLGTGENCFLRYNPQHSWWYRANQEPSEVIVFRNARLHHEGEPAPCAFHCAFHHPHADETDELRESIEVRLAAFY